jgi:transposase InsO family protein
MLAVLEQGAVGPAAAMTGAARPGWCTPTSGSPPKPACSRLNRSSYAGLWRTAEQVELATLDDLAWLNHQRLFEACGDIPPADLEAAYYRQNTSIAEAG